MKRLRVESPKTPRSISVKRTRLFSKASGLALELTEPLYVINICGSYYVGKSARSWSVELKNKWSYISTSKCAFMACT